MKIKLLRHTPEPDAICMTAAVMCRGTYPHMGVLERALDAGHESLLENASFTFKIEGISRACYDDKTEVLTDNGWKLFKDVQGNNNVLTLRDDMVAEFQQPTDNVSYRYEGVLHYYKSHFVDLAVTPNHHMVVKKHDVRTEAKWEKIASQDIKVNKVYIPKKVNLGGKYYEPGTIQIKGYSYERRNRNGKPLTVNVPDLNFPKSVFLRFLAWYLSDGSTHYDPKENKYVITISQKDKSVVTGKRINGDRIKDIISIIEAMGLHPHNDSQGVRFNSLCLGRFLKGLGRCNKKYIPFSLFSTFSPELATEFIKTYARADGHTTPGGHTKLYTTSKVLADQLQLIAYISGGSANIWIDDRVGKERVLLGHKIVSNFPCYVISMSLGARNNMALIKRDKHLTKDRYSGTVYCLTVPNGALFVRRGGKAAWCGNCSHQLVRHRLASFAQVSQRHVKIEQGYDWYVTPSSCPPDYHTIMEVLRLAYERQIEAGVPLEDARYLLPNATKTDLIMTANARSLHNFFALRCCDRAQWEIRELANEMLRHCKRVAPVLFRGAGKQCETCKEVCR